ncbi:MAG: IclR family transcriptional regulator [bacterium]|nr:IclR family transcriptional regulator [bacterium]
MKESELVRSVVKIASLLEILAKEKELGITEITNNIDVHKSTAYRFLTSLKELGYVKQNPENEKYSLTLRIFELGAEVVSRLSRREESRPIMRELANQTHETVHLATLESGEVVYIDKIDSPQTIRIYSRVGRRAPAYCTGLGKTLLAWASPESIEEILKKGELHRFTKNTIVDPARLKEEFQQIREKGYAIDNEEHEEGVYCVAAPIHGIDGKVSTAISVSMPILRFEKKGLPELQQAVIEAARKISSRLGAFPSL